MKNVYRPLPPPPASEDAPAMKDVYLPPPLKSPLQWRMYPPPQPLKTPLKERLNTLSSPPAISDVPVAMKNAI